MKHLHRLVAISSLILFAAASGCSSDSEPTSPGTMVDQPTTPDNLLAVLETALKTRSTDQLEDLFAADFAYILTDADAVLNEPPVALIDRAEMLSVFANINRSTPIINVRSQAVPAVYGLLDVSIDLISDGWAAVQGGLYEGGHVASVSTKMTLIRSPDAPDVRINAVWQITVMPVQLPVGKADEPLFVVSRVYEFPPANALGSVTLGSVAMKYITDQPPVALLEVAYSTGCPYGAVEASAIGSSDNAGDSGLMYRWLFEDGLQWSEWQAEPIRAWTFTEEGEHNVSVQVRDRWGQIGEASEPVVAVSAIPFPSSPEQLMANFQTVCENRVFDCYRQVIDTDFVIYLSQATIDEYSLPREFFDYDEEVQITERMFSGNAITRPNGDIIPGITRIQFNIFQAEAAWAVSPADHRIPNALWAPFRVDFTIDQGNEGRLNIKGIIEFYLTSEQVEHQGRTQTRYSMVGQVDYTANGAIKRPTADASWSDVKALYR